MKRVYSLLLLLVFCACKEEYIYYEYKGVKVTRVNMGKESVFYYGYCNNENVPCPEPSVVVDWSFDDIMSGYLLFHEDKRVEVIDAGGGKYKAKQDQKQKMFMKEYENPELIHYLSPYRNTKSFKNLIKISGSEETERFINQTNNSKVKAEYTSLDKTHD